MIWLSVLLLLAAPTQSVAGPSAGERARATVITRCRIAPDRLAVEQWPGAAGVVLAIKGSAPLSDEQLDCYASALAGGDVSPALDDAALSRRYREVADRQSLQLARGFLQHLGMLDGLPRREQGEALERYARRLEAYCAAPVGSVLRVETGWITLADMDAEPSPSEDPTAWLCAFNAAVVAGYNPLYAPPVPVSGE
jgi:hypothetical protein